MLLEIENQKNEDLNDLCVDLIFDIKKYAINNIDKNKARKWDKTLKSLELDWPLDETKEPVIPSFIYIVNAFCDALKIQKNGNDYIIACDPNVVLPRSNISIESLARLINFGILGTSAYNYFDKVFDHFADLFPILYQEWKGGLDVDIAI